MARVLRKSFSSLEWTAFTLFTLDDGIMMLIPEAWERWAGMWWWWWTGLEQIISYPKIMTSSTLYFIRRTPAAVQQSILTEIQQSNCCWLTVNCDWWNSFLCSNRRRNSMEKALTIYMKINLLILSLGIRIQSEAWSYWSNVLFSSIVQGSRLQINPHTVCRIIPLCSFLFHVAYENLWTDSSDRFHPITWSPLLVSCNCYHFPFFLSPACTLHHSNWLYYLSLSTNFQPRVRDSSLLQMTPI